MACRPRTESRAEFPTLVDLVRERAALHPERVAFTFLRDGEMPERHLTYGALEALSRAVGARLQAQGAAGRHVLLASPPGLDFIVAFVGCLFAGAVVVPAPLPRRGHSLRRLAAIASDARVALALTTDAALQRMGGVRGPFRWLATDEWLATEGTMLVAKGMAGSAWREPPRDPHAPALIQYTSGSTGSPKGVVVAHANLLHNAALVHGALGHTPDDTYVSWLPTFHDMGLMAGLLEPLYAGCTAVLMSPAAFLQRPVRWLQAISRHGATTSGGPNFAYDLCTRRISEDDRVGLDLGRWSAAFNGSESVRADTLDRFARMFAPNGFRREAFYPCYGLAEATLMVSGGAKEAAPVVAEFDATALGHARRAQPATGAATRTLVGCGTALGDQVVAVVEPASRRRCAAGEVGEIWVAGASVARGYWGRPQETEATFAARLDTGEGPFLRTGDLGFVFDDELFVTGRIKDVIIARGSNHYPADLERTAEESHLALRKGGGAAFSVDENGGEGVVIVQELEHRHAAASDAIGAVRRAVAEEHEIVPCAVVLIRPGTLPKTSSGKVQRLECRDRFLAGTLEVVLEWRADAAGLSATERSAGATEGLGAIEDWLVARLGSLLRIAPGRIDLERAPSWYGLDSLAAGELASQIASELGAPVSITEVLGCPSLSALAAQVFAAGPRKPAAISPLAPARGGDLSWGQRALWYLQALAPEDPGYHVAAAARLRGEADLRALERSFALLVARHGALRTGFESSQGVPGARVRSSAPFAMEVEDANGRSESEVLARMRESSHRAFDLAQPPLLRVQVARMDGGDHLLLLCAHHLVADFHSLAVLVRELAAVYSAARAGQTASLAPLRAEYHDFVRWQQSLVEGPEGERLWRFWRARLASEGPLPELPTEGHRATVRPHRRGVQRIALDEAMTRAVKLLGRSAGATLYTTLLAAFQWTLAAHAKKEEVVVGTPVGGRHRPEWKGTIGYFTNLLLLRSRVPLSATFAEHLEETRAATLDALAHQDYPFPLLVERLRPRREVWRQPLVDVVFAFHGSPFPETADLDELGAFALGCPGACIQLPGLELESLPMEGPTPPFVLALTMTESAGGLVGRLDYDANLFGAATVAALAARFEEVLAKVTHDPSRRFSDALPKAIAASTAGIRGPRGAVREACLHELFQEKARQWPEVAAVAWGDSGLTYRQLAARAEHCAAILAAHGVGPESRVVLALERSVETVVGILAILEAGGAYVPVDPAQPAARMSAIVEDSRPVIVLTSAALANSLPRSTWGAATVLSIEELDTPVTGAARPKPAAWRRAEAENLAYLLYTSGSTGRPKGVACCHRAVTNLLADFEGRRPLSVGAACSAWTSVTFDVSVYEIFSPLIAGATVHLAPAEIRADGPRFVRWLAANEIQSAYVPPFMLPDLVDALAAGRGPVSLRRLLVGVEPIPAATLASIARLLPDLELINGYGPTEAGICATLHAVSGDGDPRGPAPIGRPVWNTVVHVLDAHRRPVLPGAPGELYISGSGLARGYFGDPSSTADRFVPDPFSGERGGRLYRTGDVVRRRPGGELEFLHRADDQVKLHGYRIEPGDIQAALTEDGAVRECAVVLRHDSGGARLVAYLVPGEGGRVPVADVRARLRRRLPEYMVPTDLIWLDALPVTAHGKLDRARLPAPPDQAPTGAGAPPPLTANLFAEAVTRAFASVLGRPVVDVDASFFDLGGNSLRLVEVQKRLEADLGREIPLVELLQHPSVSALAQHLCGAETLASALEAARLGAERRRTAPLRQRGADRGPRR